MKFERPLTPSPLPQGKGRVRVSPSFTSFTSFTLLTLFTLPSCRTLPQSAAKPGFNFSVIKAVEVQAGDKIGPLISRELLLDGVTPISGATKSGADVILRISIFRQSPEKRYIVRLTKKRVSQVTSTGGSAPVATSVEFEEDSGHEPIEVTGGTAYSYTHSVFGTADSKLIATYAQISLSGELVTPITGEIVWAGSYSYEGVDLDSATEGAVRGLIRNIPWRSAN